MISKFSGLATLATSVAIQAGADAEEALVLLEEGRGIILGLLFDIRSDVSTLRTSHPELAKKFEELRDELDAPSAKSELERGFDAISLDLTRRDRLSKSLMMSFVIHVDKKTFKISWGLLLSQN